jgi:hypothetical protein
VCVRDREERRKEKEERIGRGVVHEEKGEKEERKEGGKKWGGGACETQRACTLSFFFSLSLPSFK